MNRSSFKLNRRSFLRGAGTTGLALPFLESIPERSAFAQSETPTFGLFLCTACGVVGDQFWPSETGELTTASMEADSERATSILAEHADHLLMVRGVNYPAPGGGCAHANGLVQCLTANNASGGNQNMVSTSVSCDNVIADKLGVNPLTLYAGLKGGYIEEKLSFASPGQVRAAEGNPYNVYLDLAGLLDSGTGDPAPSPMADFLMDRRKSVNDLVRDDLASLMARPQMSYEDKQRLQLHLDSIRDVETQLVAGVACSGDNLDMAALEAMQGEGFSAPYEANGSQEVVTLLQMELVALSFACNTTRVATLQSGDGTDGTQYTIDGELYERFHHISHRVNSDGSGGSAIAGAEGKHARIDRLRMETFKAAIDKWSLYSTPNGPLLDNGFIYWTSHVSDGPSHSFNNLPIVIAGSGGGFLKQGAYVDGDGSSNAKVLNALMTANGVPTEDFGSGGTGYIDEMLA